MKKLLSKHVTEVKGINILRRCAIKWFKHATNSRNDQDMILLLDEFGYEGYGVYWCLLETISEQIKKTSEIAAMTKNLQQWKNSVKISSKKFEKVLNFCSENFGFIVKKDEKNKNLITIEIPKLLKYRDEYTVRKT